MNRLVIENGQVVFPKKGITERSILTVKDGMIEGMGGESAEIGGTRLDVEGGYVCPGFIDLQVNGGAGVDFLTCDPLEPGTAGNFWLSHGTTSFLATIITNPIEEMNHAIGILSRSNAPNILGIHVEGPFLSHAKRGTHNEEHLREPNRRDFEDIVNRYEDDIRLVTFAPELRGAEELLDCVRDIGAVPSIGHSDANYDRVLSFLDLGVTSFTHLFNGMKGFHHRKPGTVGAALNSDAFVGLIVDGLHLSPGAVKLAERAKGSGKICLVTDAIAAAGMKDGRYVLGDQEIVVEEGLAKLENGTIAGSTLTLENAVSNFIDFTGVSLPEAIRTVTLNPADLLGMAGEIGTLEEGTRADLVVLDRELEVKYSIVDGEVVYESEN